MILSEVHLSESTPITVTPVDGTVASPLPTVTASLYWQTQASNSPPAHDISLLGEPIPMDLPQPYVHFTSSSPGSVVAFHQQ
jgi:hypothetical protein